MAYTILKEGKVVTSTSLEGLWVLKITATWMYTKRARQTEREIDREREGERERGGEGEREGDR